MWDAGRVDKYKTMQPSKSYFLSGGRVNRMIHLQNKIFQLQQETRKYITARSEGRSG
jgi:hypothetical protein